MFNSGKIPFHLVPQAVAVEKLFEQKKVPKINPLVNYFFLLKSVHRFFYSISNFTIRSFKKTIKVLISLSETR